MGVDLALWPCKHLLSFCSAWQPVPRPNTLHAQSPTASSFTPTSSTATSSTSAPTAPCTRRFMRTGWCLTGTVLSTTTATTTGPSTAGRGSTTTPPSPHLDVSTSLASTRLERDARQLSSSALLGSPMRLRATRVLPTTQRSTSATTLTRCHIVRNSRRVLLGLNAPRLMSFLQMLLPGASCLSPGSQCPATRRLTSCAWPTIRGSTTVETTASLTHRPFLASTISPSTWSPIPAQQSTPSSAHSANNRSST